MHLDFREKFEKEISELPEGAMREALIKLSRQFMIDLATVETEDEFKKTLHSLIMILLDDFLKNEKGKEFFYLFLLPNPKFDFNKNFLDPFMKKLVSLVKMDGVFLIEFSKQGREMLDLLREHYNKEEND